MARRALRLQDLFKPVRFAEKLTEILDFHNFVLSRYFSAETVDFQRTLDELVAQAEQMTGLALPEDLEALQPVLALTPRGKPLTQAKVRELAAGPGVTPVPLARGVPRPIGRNQGSRVAPMSPS